MVEILYKKYVAGTDDDEKEFADRVLREYGERNEVKLKEEMVIEVYVKKFGKIKTNEYEVTLRLICSGNKTCSKYFFEAKASERDFGKAVHSALKKLDNEIEHKMHLMDQNKR